MPDHKHMEAIHRHCADKVEDMMDGTPDVIWETMAQAEGKEVKRPFFALFMTFLTYLFTHELIMLKRKDKKDERRET